MRSLGIKAISKAAGCVAIAAVLAATTIHFRHDDARPAEHSGTAATEPNDLLTVELARCRTIGLAAKDDAACAAAWAENRRRFFNYVPSVPAANATARQPQ